MAISSRIATLLILVAACGFPRPLDVASDADAPDQPGITVHVSSTGDDANDGMTKPVKTLKHAIGIAAANNQVTNIVLASGRYASANGETFPYTVPANVTIAGPAGGGAILAGTKTEPGMMVDTGKLQDLEFEDFTVAITATGMARVTNVHVRTSMIAVRGESTAKLTVDNLDITGTIAACETGIVLNGATDLAATTLATRNLGTTLEAKDQSTVNIAKASIMGDRSCTHAAMVVATNKTFTLRDSMVDGGKDGISFSTAPPSLQVIITNTFLRDFVDNAISGGVAATFEMIGGELSGNGRGGADIFHGTWIFTNVAIKQNPAFGLYVQDATLVMRGCMVTGNGYGVYLLTPGNVDLGTDANPGNNTFQNNSGSNIDEDTSAIQVEAVGNIWNPGVQGADNLGKYSTVAVIQAPVSYVSYNNYSLSCDPGQCTLHR